jgi:hypothetical protein
VGAQGATVEATNQSIQAFRLPEVNTGLLYAIVPALARCRQLSPCPSINTNGDILRGKGSDLEATLMEDTIRAASVTR